MLAQLVHCFDWKLSNGIEGSDMDMTENLVYLLLELKPLVIVPTCSLHKY